MKADSTVLRRWWGRDARLGTNAGPQDQLSGVQLILGLVRGPMGLAGPSIVDDDR